MPVLAAVVAIGLVGQPSRASAVPTATTTVTATGTVNEVETITATPSSVILTPVGNQQTGGYDLSNEVPAIVTITANLRGAIGFSVPSTMFTMDSKAHPGQGYTMPCHLALTPAGLPPVYVHDAVPGVHYTLQGQNSYSFGVVYTVNSPDWINVPGGAYGGNVTFTVTSNH